MKKMKQLGDQGTKSASKFRWMLGCSVVVASLVAVNLLIKQADFHDLARDYHQDLKSDADQRLQVLSLVTKPRD